MCELSTTTHVIVMVGKPVVAPMLARCPVIVGWLLLLCKNTAGMPVSIFIYVRLVIRNHYI